MTNAIAAENQALQYDNKQLNLLIKEYEQTLETLMTTFRKRAVSSSSDGFRVPPSVRSRSLMLDLTARDSGTRARAYPEI